MSLVVCLISSIFCVVRGGGRGGDKLQKTVQSDKKIMSIAPNISGTIHHVIVIYGAHV